MSRQSIQISSGNDVDFHKSDETGDRCQDINQFALEYALNNASAPSLHRYHSKGVKLMLSTDLGPYNAGPLWIWT